MPNSIQVLQALPQQVFNVKSFGAAGDGVTDDTTAIQAAITASQTAGGIAWIPPTATGYLVSSTLNGTADNLQIMGGGWGSQLIASPTFSGSHMIYVQGGGSFRYGWRVQDVFLNCNSVSSLNGLNLESTYHCVLDHVRVRYCAAVGIYFNGVSNKFGAYSKVLSCTVTDGVGSSAIGLQTNDSEWLEVHGSSFVTYTTSGNFGMVLNNLNCIIDGCQFDNCDTALWLSFASRAVVANNQFDRAYTRFINLRGCQATTIGHNIFNTNKGSGTECIYVNDPNNQGCCIIGNTVEPQSGWTYFVNESATVGGPGNIYSGNALNGTKMNLVTGKAANNPGFNPTIRIPSPSAPTISNSSTGGTVPAGTWPAEITYVNAYGETTVSASASTTTTGTTSTITINAPPQLGNAIGWYAYISSDGGVTYHRQKNSAGNEIQQFGNNLVLTAAPTTSGATPPGGNTTSYISQPAVPSSNTAYRNAFGVDCTVYVTGGTVSSIKVGDLTTGVTSGAFRVPAYSSININYSAAPTWEWIGE